MIPMEGHRWSAVMAIAAGNASQQIHGREQTFSLITKSIPNSPLEGEGTGLSDFAYNPVRFASEVINDVLELPIVRNLLLDLMIGRFRESAESDPSFLGREGGGESRLPVPPSAGTPSTN